MEEEQKKKLFHRTDDLLFLDTTQYVAVGGMKNFHYHNSYEVFYLLNGKCKYIIGDDYFTLSKGDVVLIKKGVLHKTVGNEYERTVINFTTEYLEKFFTEEAVKILLSCFEFHKVITIPSIMRTKIKTLFDNIAEFEESEKKDTLFIYLADFLNTISGLADRKKQSVAEKINDDKIITKALHYISAHYSEIENISEIAEKFYITKYHLCRLFKNATNASIIEYLNRIKILNACSMLENTDKTVVEICTACGFNSSVYFCKLFKKLMNMTPLQYREKIKNKKENED